MTGEGLEINVTNMRDFAAVLWSRVAEGGEWDTKVKQAIELLNGSDDGSKAAESSSVATVGTTSEVEYHGVEVGKLQAENIPLLVTYLKAARQSIEDAAIGATVISEDFHGQDGANAKDTEATYEGFGESAPHGLYPGQ